MRPTEAVVFRLDRGSRGRRDAVKAIWTVASRGAERAQPVHIAFFNRSFYPDTTATGQLLTELCEALAGTQGCRVSVVAGVPLLPAVEGGARVRWRLWHERYRNIDIIRVPGSRFSKRRSIGRFTNYMSYFLSACYAGLRLRRPDVVVALTDPPIIGLAGYLAARRFRVPFVMAYNDIFPEVARLLEDFRSETVMRVLEAVTCFLARKADRVVALGESMQRVLIEKKGADPGKTLVIPYWADCSAITPGPKDNAFSRAHGLTDKFVVMHSGNIGLSQGLEALVEAAVHLSTVPNLEIVFVGDGVKRPALEARTRALGLLNVRFLPYQPKEGLRDSFAAADVFVISLRQGLAGYIVPSKLYGILAAGRPYIAAVEESCEVSAIAKKYDCGLLVEPGNASQIAVRALELYENRALGARLGANGRKAALAFDRSIQIRAYSELFRELARNSLSRRHASRSWAKRALDFVLAGGGLLVSAPLWGVIAAAIKLDDVGAIFYGQERVGRYGTRFKSWKFRSMVADADERFGPLQAKDRDSRITRVGRVLRATAMDELPQLWNILRGEMSFVGPRALVPEEIEVNGNGQVVPLEKIPGYEERHRVVPGLTGLAQIYAPRDLPRRHKFKLDALYIRKQSFWLDLKLIAASFWITFRGKWEHRGRKV